MKLLREIGQELLGMFIDSNGFALTIVGVVVALTVMVKLLRVPAEYSGLILLCGCIAVLIDNVHRR